MQSTRLVIVMGCAFLAASCAKSATPAGGNNATDGNTAGGQGGTLTSLLNETDGDNAATAAPAPVAAACEDGAYCSGPLLVKVDRLALVDGGSGAIGISGTLTIQNRSAEELRVVHLKSPVVMNFLNGGMISSEGDARFQLTGIHTCANAGSDCPDGAQRDFLSLRAGDSPARVTLVMYGTLADNLRTSLRNDAKGTLTLELLIAAGSGEARPVQVVLPDVAMTDQLG